MSEIYTRWLSSHLAMPNATWESECSQPLLLIRQRWPFDFLVLHKPFATSV